MSNYSAHAIKSTNEITISGMSIGIIVTLEQAQKIYSELGDAIAELRKDG